MLRRVSDDKTPSGIYKAFLSRSFRDEEVVPLSEKQSGMSYLPYEDTIGLSASIEPFLSKCVKINDEDSAYNLRYRVVDVKRIAPVDEQQQNPNEPLGFALLVRNESGKSHSYSCLVRLFKEPPEKQNLPDSTPSLTADSSADSCGSGHCYYDLDRSRCVSIPVQEATTSTRLHYAGCGMLIVATTGTRSTECRIHLVDLCAQKIALSKLCDNNSIMISVFVMADIEAPRTILISCVSPQSQWTIKLSRTQPAGTPRPGPVDAAPAAVTVTSGKMKTGLQLKGEVVHLAWKEDTFLVVPQEKTSKGTCVYNGQVTEIKQHIAGSVIPLYTLRALVCSNEEGFVGILSLTNPVADGVQDFRRVFEGSQSKIISFERCSSPNWILACTSTSCVLISVEQKEANKFSFVVLAKRSSSKNASYSMLNVHLHRELQRNVPYALLCGDSTEDCVQLLSLMKLKSIILGGAVTSVDLGPPASLASETPPSTASTEQKKGFLSSIKARFSRVTRSQAPLDRALFSSQVSDVLTTYGEGYSRKMKTSDLRLFERRVLALDGRLHAFVVAVHHVDHDEVFLYRDARLQESLQGIKRMEDEMA
jgi:hypothetical protein